MPEREKDDIIGAERRKKEIAGWNSYQPAAAKAKAKFYKSLLYAAAAILFHIHNFPYFQLLPASLPLTETSIIAITTTTIIIRSVFPFNIMKKN
jgi:hypothetical protein